MTSVLASRATPKGSSTHRGAADPSSPDAWRSAVQLATSSPTAFADGRKIVHWRKHCYRNVGAPLPAGDCNYPDRPASGLSEAERRDIVGRSLERPDKFQPHTACRYTCRVRKNLHVAKEMSEQSTTIGELCQVEEALRSLKEKLESIQKFLPRPTKKRGLFNIGGTVLKSLFGTATLLDLQSLHETIDDLHRRQDSVTHSLHHQLTSIK
jgi:hypothetical protein